MSIDGEFDTAIVAVEARLRELDAAREAATRELAELRTQSEWAISDDAAESGPTGRASWTPQRKVALFAGLFRGREDVFPHRWEKPAKGKSGWAPRRRRPAAR